jgi:hypothetical protein
VPSRRSVTRHSGFATNLQSPLRLASKSVLRAPTIGPIRVPQSGTNTSSSRRSLPRRTGPPRMRCSFLRIPTFSQVLWFIRAVDRSEVLHASDRIVFVWAKAQIDPGPEYQIAFTGCRLLSLRRSARTTRYSPCSLHPSADSAVVHSCASRAPRMQLKPATCLIRCTLAVCSEHMSRHSRPTLRYPVIIYAGHAFRQGRSS